MRTVMISVPKCRTRLSLNICEIVFGTSHETSHECPVTQSVRGHFGTVMGWHPWTASQSVRRQFPAPWRQKQHCDVLLRCFYAVVASRMALCTPHAHLLTDSIVSKSTCSICWLAARVCAVVALRMSVVCSCRRLLDSPAQILARHWSISAQWSAFT